ncbi:MAG: hypothetical protein JO063_15620, partial [Pseudonocardiales bacterium]|nr:hypothetical protein [Pseudonocardiales bacterium]
IAELLHGRLTGFAILESFRCTPGQPEGLTGKAVDSATARENKRSGNQAAREALGILSGAAKAALDLRKLTLFHLLDDVREHHRQGAPPTALLTQLHQARLDPAEARQAVFSVLHETVTSPATDLRTITELLAQGRLIAAQQALAALTDPEEATAAKDQVRRHADQVRRLREGAHESLRTGDEADARHRLRQAAVLATDDEDIAGELGRIPPPPVLEVSARLEGVGVRVSWRAPASHGEDTRYRVVRRRGRVPADPDDGTVLVNPLVGGEAATVLVDPRAPAGHLVGYAVFAATEEGVWSRPAGVSSEVLPPVHNVRLTAEQGSVEGHWQVNPDVLAVEVHRGAGLTGIAVPTASTTTFRDGVGTDGDDGADHVYTLVARYLRSDGSEARSAAVVARATSRGPALPVTGLRHQRLGPEVVLSWSWPEQAGTVEVRWRTPTDSGRYRLTRQRYLDAGGCRIRAGPDRLDVQVRSVVAAGGAERLSEAAELTVADLPPAVSYTVDMVRRPLIGGGTVRVRLTATQPVGHAVVLVVVAPGPVMPRRPTDGRVVLRSGLDLAAGHEVALRAELPRVRRPYWVRCFLEDSAGPRLIDPPTTQLKVS